VRRLCAARLPGWDHPLQFPVFSHVPRIRFVRSSPVGTGGFYLSPRNCEASFEPPPSFMSDRRRFSKAPTPPARSPFTVVPPVVRGWLAGQRRNARNMSRLRWKVVSFFRRTFHGFLSWYEPRRAHLSTRNGVCPTVEELATEKRKHGRKQPRMRVGTGCNGT